MKGKCKNCKYANYYQAYFWYPWLDPYCEISKKSIHPDGTCIYFERIGRLSR